MVGSGADRPALVGDTEDASTGEAGATAGTAHVVAADSSAGEPVEVSEPDGASASANVGILDDGKLRKICLCKLRKCLFKKIKKSFVKSGKKILVDCDLFSIID